MRLRPAHGRWPPWHLVSPSGVVHVVRDEISLKLLADTYPDVIVSRETPSSPPPPPPGLHPTSSTTDGCWPPSLDAAGAISISAIVAFSSTSTAAVVTFFWQQLSKVSLRLLDPFEHARPCASLMPSFDNRLGRFRLARVPHRLLRHKHRHPDRDGSGWSWTRAQARSTRCTSRLHATPLHLAFQSVSPQPI